MQIGSRELSSKAKPKLKVTDGKPSKRTKATAKSDTLHLKAKHLIATPIDTAGIVSMIATEAYHRAARRGFEPGHELDDWLHAEKIVLAQLPI
jgi:hypothetical protein